MGSDSSRDPQSRRGCRLSTNDGGPAFPSGDGEHTGCPSHTYGMSLRAHFAAQALVGILAGPLARDLQISAEALHADGHEQAKAMTGGAAVTAILAADALIRLLQQPPNQST